MADLKKLERENQNEFTGEIIVASRIVDYLSSGLYKTPAACLKELINNSYDADATEVNVFVKPGADRIIIEDNGCGMDRADFEKHFQRISESYKRDESDKTKSGRPKIGKIGIGFIAANEICDVMEIRSTKKGTTELLEVSIHFDLMRQDIEERRRNEDGVAKGDYLGTVSKTNSESHFTQIFLTSIRGEARVILAGVGDNEFLSGKKALYGLSAESTARILKEKDIKTWNEFDAYSKNLLEIGLNVPVQYHNTWIPDNLMPQVRDIVRESSSLNFSVYIDGSEIRKPIVYNHSSRNLISRFNFEGEHVSARGYFYVQDSTIKPQELQGVLIRIRNAAVGEYDPSFRDFTSSIGPLFQSWISGEIMADDRLEAAMNIDRSTLRVSHPAYVELQKALHGHIADLLKKVRSEIYGTRSQERNVGKAKDVTRKIIEVAEKEVASISPKAAISMKTAWSDTAREKENQKFILRKFTVDQLYQIVVEIAEEILEPKQLDTFLSRLTDRIKK